MRIDSVFTKEFNAETSNFLLEAFVVNNCKTCGKEHDGNYGSGKYCCLSCSNSHSHSMETREKISAKVKQSCEAKAKAKVIRHKRCLRCCNFFAVERVIHQELGEKIPEKEKKCCSRACANKRIHSNETKQKIARSAKKYANENKELIARGRNEHICYKCGQTFYSHRKKLDYCQECELKSKGYKKVGEKFKKTCVECGEIYYRRYKKSGDYCSGKCNPKMGGYRENSVKSYKAGTYDGISFDSSWELAFYLYCKDKEVQIERNKQGFPYFYDGKKRLYYPDFIINGNEYIEIKGYVQPETKFKLESFPYKITLMTRDELQPIFEHVSKSYGTDDFYKLYKA